MIQQLIGNRIREVRKEKGYSQEELAARADLDRTYMTSVECGKRNISIVNLYRIAQALGITLEELFRGLCNEKS